MDEMYLLTICLCNALPSSTRIMDLYSTLFLCNNVQFQKILIAPQWKGFFPLDPVPRSFENYNYALYISLKFLVLQKPSPRKFQSSPLWEEYRCFLKLHIVNGICLLKSRLLFSFNDTRSFGESFIDLCYHVIIACSATHSENKRKYHQHVKLSGTNRSACSCCICCNQGKQT